MSHEVIVFGSIEGADPEPLRALNKAVLAELPIEEEWPWLVRGMFALPAEWPRGTYRSQVIHFGASFKDEPQDRACWDVWIGKFEALLRRLYWWSATLHLETEFEPERVFRWLPTAAAIERMAGDPPLPVQEWQRSVVDLANYTNWHSSANDS
ncbi:MAG: hypothetical protein ACKVP0_09645 [Pirellulaceae bacterium]